MGPQTLRVIVSREALFGEAPGTHRRRCQSHPARQPQGQRSKKTLYPFERFTERAKKVLTLAQEEAERSHHSYIGTEHLLLGLLREGEGLAATALNNLRVELNEGPAT